MDNKTLCRTSLGKYLRLFSYLFLATVVLVCVISCKPFDYPVNQLILDVTYTGTTAWSISVKPGDSLPDKTGDQSLPLDEADGPFVIIIEKNEVTADTLTATLTLKTVWINGETSAEMTAPPPDLQQIDQQSTSDPNGSVIINY